MSTARPEEAAEPRLLASGLLGVVARFLPETSARPDAGQARRLRTFAGIGDPLADDLAAEMRRLPEGQGRWMFEEALAEGIDALSDPPPALVRFFRALEDPPYWLDPDRVDAGARAVGRVGLLGLFPLGDLALMGGYLASRAAKTLIGSGALSGDAGPRLVATAAWWIELTTPGALRGRGAGYRAAVRVRLVHAHVRAGMRARPEWDYEAWDEPINQVQTVGTLLLFSYVYLLGTRMLGVRYSAEERDAVLHLWRYVGWLMGVDAELLPATEADCWRLLCLLDATEFRPDEDSRRLARVLLDVHAAFGDGLGPLRGLAGRGWLSVHGAISRLALGTRHADFLGIPNDVPAQALVVSGALATFAGETARRWIPGATAVARRAGVLSRRWYLDQARQDR